MTREDSAETPAQRLARYVRERREQLGYTQRQVALLGQLGLTTVQSIERGEVDRPALQTRHALARALRWTPDSVKMVLSGKEPSSTEEAVATIRADLQQAEAILRASEQDLRHGHTDENSVNWQRNRVAELSHRLERAIVLEREANELTAVVAPTRDDADGVLLDLPEEALAGLDQIEREEVIAAARLAALKKAREIRAGGQVGLFTVE